MKKRFFSSIMALCLIVSCITIPITANAATSFSGGSGTSGDPYLISTYEDLVYFSSYVNAGNSTSGKYFKLTNDIIANDTANYRLWSKHAPQNLWTPIGTSARPFYGTFDGNGCYIKGLYINSTSSYQGLFGYIYNATVKNVTISKSYIKGGSDTAAVVGYAYAEKATTRITNCHNLATVIGTSNTGGIVGNLRSGTHSYTSENIYVSKCSNKGKIKGSSYVGGIAGYSYIWSGATIQIEYCSNTGEISGTSNVGGILGYQFHYEVGTKKTIVTYCYNTGSVNGASYVGGIIGYNDRSKVRICYNMGIVKGTSYVGGIAGYHSNSSWSSGTDGEVYQCYNVGYVVGSTQKGGIVGQTVDSSMKQCYRLNSCIIGASNSQGTALTIEQMKEQANYTDWSFSSTWELGKSGKYEFPTLKSNLHNEKAWKDMYEGMIKVVATKNGQEVGMENAVITVYEGAEALTDEDVTIVNVGGGWYDLEWHRSIPQNATISAYAVISSGSGLEGNNRDENNRDELFKKFTENGEVERYILEIHSETIDKKGNWCGVSFDELSANGNMLTLSEPRLKVNLAVCYYANDGNSQDASYYNSVVDKMNNYAYCLAQATDGHVIVNKIIIDWTQNREDFYINKGTSVEDYKLPALADIQIQTLDAGAKGEAIHSGAVASGFWTSSPSNAEIISEKYNIEWFKNISEEELARLSAKEAFPSIRIGYRDANGYFVTPQSIAHESGHYILGFKDEYMNGDNKQWTNEFYYDFNKYHPRLDGMPENFGLMENQRDSLELSKSFDYAYAPNNQSQHTAHSYLYGMSTEATLALLLQTGHHADTNGSVKKRFENNEYDIKYTLTNTKDRTAEYSYAIPSEIIDIREKYNVPALMSIDEEGNTETISVDVTTDGYLYESYDNKVMGYVIPESDTTYTFTPYNDTYTYTYTYAYYTSVNQATEITTANGVATTKGELYSVASIEDNIDYSSVSWFVKQNDEWKQLETKLSTEENDNIGATCDFVGDGLYVLMAKSADATALAPVTDIKAETGALYDTQISVTFNDTNENTAYYKIYCSENPFNTIDDSLNYVMYPKNESNIYTLNLSESEASFYCGVVAVANNGASSALSEVVNLTKEYNDSDGDGIPDYWCSKYLLWDLEDIAGSDSDNDGLTNLQEFNANTNPLKADTDEDFVNDKKELDLGLNPLNKMSDGITPDAYIAYGNVDIEVSNLYITPYSSKLDGICDFDTTAVIKNNSEMTVENAKLQFFFDGSLVSEQLISLEGGEEKEVDFIGENVTFPQEVTVKIVTDGIDDSNTDNNIKTLELTGGIDLSIKEKYAHSNIFKAVISLQNYFSEYAKAYLSLKAYDNNDAIVYSEVKNFSCDYGYRELNYIEAIQNSSGALKLECALYSDSDCTDLISKEIVETTVEITEVPVTDASNFVFDSETQSITQYIGSDWYVNIPETINGISVNKISESAFYDNTSIYGLKIPESVTDIGDLAFMACSNLVQINIPSTVTDIGYRAFYGTEWFRNQNTEEFVIVGDNLLLRYNGTATEITVPDGVKQILSEGLLKRSASGGAAISQPMTKVILPEGVEKIGKEAFRKSKKLVEINIPSTMKVIDDYAFYNCSSLTKITLPTQMDYIGASAFSDCTALTSCNLPENLKEIPEYLFSGCSKLQDLSISNTVTSIGNYTFYQCAALKEIELPESLITIGKNSFSYCSGIEKIIIPSNVDSVGNNAFSYCSLLDTVLFIGKQPSIMGTTIFTSCAANICLYAFNDDGTWNISTLNYDVTLFNDNVGISSLNPDGLNVFSKSPDNTECIALLAIYNDDVLADVEILNFTISEKIGEVAFEKYKNLNVTGTYKVMLWSDLENLLSLCEFSTGVFPIE